MTDDLTRRARAEILVLNAVPNVQAVYTQDLLSELADEVDGLRAERDAARAEADRFRTLWDRHGKNDLLAERDAARAALGRVKGLRASWSGLADIVAQAETREILTAVASDLTRALEGEA